MGWILHLHSAALVLLHRLLTAVGAGRDRVQIYPLRLRLRGLQTGYWRLICLVHRRDSLGEDLGLAPRPLERPICVHLAAHRVE